MENQDSNLETGNNEEHSQFANSEQEEQLNYKEMYEKAQEDMKKILAKKEELLQETKKAKKDREEHASAAAKAEQEKALKDGEYEKLWKSAEEQAKQHEERYKSLLHETKNEKIQTNAMKIAIELADGNAQSAKLLAKFVGESLGQLAGEHGQLDDSVIQAVKKEFQSNQDYAPLISGSKASGGGAPGNSRAIKSTSEMTREDFSKLTPFEQGKFFSEKKGQLID